MADTKIITPTKTRFFSLAAAVVLGLFAFINLVGYAQPLLKKNADIVSAMADTAFAPVDSRIKTFNRLRDEQENLLALNPAEPFAWARLSYLRRATAGERAAAMEALRLSDLVSPNEPRQMFERILMWRDLQDVQTQQQRDYVSILWIKAFRLYPYRTMSLVKEMEASAEVDAAMKSASQEIQQAWENRKIR